jgi:ribosomal protein L11 methylase PrmA
MDPFTVVFGVFAVLVILFGFVVAFGAPYLPTLRPQITMALDMLDLKKGQTLLELGSGDGRVMMAAAERGWNVIGYELNPLLVGLGSDGETSGGKNCHRRMECMYFYYRNI